MEKSFNAFLENAMENPSSGFNDKTLRPGVCMITYVRKFLDN